MICPFFLCSPSLISSPDANFFADLRCESCVHSTRAYSRNQQLRKVIVMKITGVIAARPVSGSLRRALRGLGDHRGNCLGRDRRLAPGAGRIPKQTFNPEREEPVAPKRRATAIRAAICLFWSPSAASKTMQHRWVTRTGVVRRRTSLCNSVRASGLKSIAGATRMPVTSTP